MFSSLNAVDKTRFLTEWIKDAHCSPQWNTIITTAKLPLESFEELLSRDSSSRVDSQFHFTYLLVDLLHKVYNEVDQLVLVHLLCVEVCYQKTNVITLPNTRAGQCIFVNKNTCHLTARSICVRTSDHYGFCCTKRWCRWYQLEL